MTYTEPLKYRIGSQTIFILEILKFIEVEMHEYLYLYKISISVW